jgi:cation diffusion facilitator CzcD-associated flavoprotein CzcO
VKEFGVDEHLNLKHEVLSAVWSDNIKQWVVKVQNLATREVFTETSDFFISAAGRLNVPKYPKIPGLETVYKGTVVHTAEWTDGLTKNLKGKRVAVIGNGASGQQILVNILEETAHIDHYVRSRQWTVSSFNPNLVSAKIDLAGAHIYTDEEKKNFDNEPQAYLEYRREIERYFHGRYEGTISGSQENDQIRQKYEEELLTRLGGDKSWFDRLVPNFAPGCKRPIPSAGYIDAIRNSKVDYVDGTKITHATATGLVTEDRKERPIDIVIVATGFENGFLPLFPTIGKNGVDLGKLWAEDGPIGYPETYFGVMAPNIPNYFAVVQVS